MQRLLRLASLERRSGPAHMHQLTTFARTSATRLLTLPPRVGRSDWGIVPFLQLMRTRWRKTMRIERLEDRVLLSLTGSTFESNDGNLIHNVGGLDWDNAPSRAQALDRPTG